MQRVDVLISRTWWTLVMALIVGAALGGLAIGYTGLFELLAGRLAGASAASGAGLLLACVAYLLARHRNDVLCD